MTYALVDDQFADHPKVLRLGADRYAGMGLWLVARCYVGKYLTDGFVPLAALPGDAESVRLAQRLVEVGLWEEDDGGFRLHDYLDHNRSRADVLALKTAQARGGKIGAERRWRREAEPMAPAMGSAVGGPMSRPMGSQWVSDTDTDTETDTRASARRASSAKDEPTSDPPDDESIDFDALIEQNEAIANDPKAAPVARRAATNQVRRLKARKAAAS